MDAYDFNVLNGMELLVQCSRAEKAIENKPKSGQIRLNACKLQNLILKIQLNSNWAVVFVCECVQSKKNV